MIVIPAKLLPWICLIGGVCGILSGEDFLLSLLMTGIGAGWLYLKKKHA